MPPHEHYPAEIDVIFAGVIKQVKDFVSSNHSWFELNPERPQKVLDYACGAGTVSESVALICPNTVFQGVDMSPQQVARFNQTSSKLLGTGCGRMFAIEGDLAKSSLALQASEWYNFDLAVSTFALHHFTDPVDMLRRISERVKSGGVVAVADWLAGVPVPQTEAMEFSGKEPYHPHHNAHPDGMGKVNETPIWRGFTEESVEACLLAAGLQDVEIRLHNEVSQLPERFGGSQRMFFAKAYVQ